MLFAAKETVSSELRFQSDGRTGVRRTVTPASLYDYCSSLPGYSGDLPAQVIDEMIERCVSAFRLRVSVRYWRFSNRNFCNGSAKAEGFEFGVPDDVIQETEQFILSFGDDVVFTDDEKLRLPFIFG